MSDLQELDPLTRQQILSALQNPRHPKETWGAVPDVLPFRTGWNSSGWIHLDLGMVREPPERFWLVTRDPEDQRVYQVLGPATFPEFLGMAGFQYRAEEWQALDLQEGFSTAPPYRNLQTSRQPEGK